MKGRADLPAPALLVVAESWDARWKAKVRGLDARLVRADFAFMALALEPGVSEIELRYEPRHVGAAVALTVAALLAMLVLWFRRR